MDFQTRNAKSPTTALPSSYDSLSLFLSSMGSSSVQQQQQVNASQQPSLQPTQRETSSTFQTFAVDLPPHRPIIVPHQHHNDPIPPMNQSPSISHSPSNRMSPVSIYSYSDIAHDRPLKCDQCLQSFNRNHDLKLHKRIHLAVKPFPCVYCEKILFAERCTKGSFFTQFNLQ